MQTKPASLMYQFLLFLVTRSVSNILQIIARVGSISLTVLTLWYGLGLAEQGSLDIQSGYFNIPAIRFGLLGGIVALEL